MSVAAFGWRMPVDVRFGAGCSEQIADDLGDRDVLALAFEPAEALGLRERWSAAFGARLLDWVSVPEGLSSIALARRLAGRVWPRLAAAPGCVLVGLGGGSTLDIAKLLRCRPATGGGFDAIAAALRGLAPWPSLTLAPLWLVPTTSGTGSEVTRWATLWDTEAEPAVKHSFDEPWGWAERAFVDPLLPLTCPTAVTRDCALDTLAHALEALWNRHANPVSDRLAVRAAQRVIETLPGLLHAPRSRALREQMSLAALEAGLAFSQTRTALAHALSYDVTLKLGIPHGQACALWLPTAWRLAVGRSPRADAALAEVFDAPADAGPELLANWLRSIGLDATPAAYGITDAGARVAAALASPRGRNFIGAAA